MSFSFDRDEVLVVEGLAAPASIHIDRHGVPHLRAGNLDDLWFMQGFNAARDRLFQIDIWRKRGLGLLAADFGPGFLEQDRAARMFLYRGDMDAEWRAYADDAKGICERFVAGINAYIALTEREPDRLPPEFARLGITPARWRAEDVVRIRTHGLSRQAFSKVLRAHVTANAGPDIDALRRRITPSVEPTRFDDLPMDSIPLDVVDDLKLATAQATFTPERMTATLAEARKWRKTNETSDVVADSFWHGSNNWVISGEKSGTGKPLLASDPHRAHSLPSLRYIVHLTAPGFDAVGAGEPGVPGICIGHNGDAAFGITIFGADHEDVYVYETHPDDPDLYRYKDGWERMRRVAERIPAKGHDDQIVTLRFTRHGPVTAAEADKHRAYAVRSVWFEPGAAPYLGSLTTMRARDWAAFREGDKRWGAPSMNHVFADQSGTIAWIPGGLIPRREGWNGLLPVPGDGRCEWSGFLSVDAYPARVNPASGYAFSANEMNLPHDWPHDEIGVGFDWADRSRADRITEVLDAQTPHGVAEARALQTDEESLPARRLCALLTLLDVEPGDLAIGVGLLRGWDARETAKSAAAALFEIWWTKHLKPALFRAATNDATLALLLAPGDADAVVSALESASRVNGVASAQERDLLLRETLVSAVAQARDLMGEDVSAWGWGRLHHALFTHPLAALRDEGDDLRDIGPLPLGGSATTVKLAAYRPADFRLTNGASFRMIVDLSNLDGSLCVNAPGQSGDPRSRHYDRLAPIWAASDYAPMLYSREAVDAATEFTWRLKPA